MFQSAYRPNKVTVIGMIAVGMAVAISSFGIVRAERAHQDSSVYCVSTGYCQTYSNTGSGGGVEAASKSTDGVHGITSSTSGSSAVAGISNGKSGNAHGVYGSSSNGNGVYGTSSATNIAGVYGTSSGGDGVFGIASNSSGPYSYSGVYGYMKGNGTGVYGESNDKSGFYDAIGGRGDNAKTNLFYVENEKTLGDCLIDPLGALSCSGSATFKNVRTQHTSSGGQHVLAYGSESTSATIEDFGTARLNRGVANVYFKSDFASTIDRNSPYYVFLTPLGDTRGLYVSIKSASGFQVRETESGRSRLEFDYRIVAHPIDAGNDRLPLAPAVRRLPLPVR